MGLRTHTALWASITVLVLFLVGHIFIGSDPARIVVTSLVIGVNIAVCLTWFKRFLSAIANGISDGAQNIYFGVWIGAFVILAYFVWVVVVISLGRPDWAKTLPVGGILTVGFFVSAVALLLTPLNTKEEIEPISLRWWFTAVAIGGIAAGSLMTLAFLGVVDLAMGA